MWDTAFTAWAEFRQNSDDDLSRWEHHHALSCETLHSLKTSGSYKGEAYDRWFSATRTYKVVRRNRRGRCRVRRVKSIVGFKRVPRFPFVGIAHKQCHNYDMVVSRFLVCYNSKSMGYPLYGLPMGAHCAITQFFSSTKTSNQRNWLEEKFR